MVLIIVWFYFEFGSLSGIKWQHRTKSSVVSTSTLQAHIGLVASPKPFI